MNEKGKPESEARPLHSGNERIYWAKAKGYQLANWVPEKREAGIVVQMEQPLIFVDHVKVTDDRKMQGFIENSQAFKSGNIRRVNSMEEAAALTRQVSMMRSITKITSTYQTLTEPTPVKAS